MPKRRRFDQLDLLTACAVGEPGKRTFFLAAGQQGEWVRLWLEKQDLQSLAMGIRQLLFNVWKNQSAPSTKESAAPSSTGDPSGLPVAELQLDRMELAHGETGVNVEITAHLLGPLATKEELHLHATVAQLRDLANRADAVCAAGRPICPVCGGPIDPEGHTCPGNN